VVENSFGQERFFVEDPSSSLRRGSYYKVPILAGRTEHEFSFMMSGKKAKRWLEKSPATFLFLQILQTFKTVQQ
jgi:hypothetical protein